MRAVLSIVIVIGLVVLILSARLADEVAVNVAANLLTYGLLLAVGANSDAGPRDRS